jgi:hypothetical protein
MTEPASIVSQAHAGKFLVCCRFALTPADADAIPPEQMTWLAGLAANAQPATAGGPMAAGAELAGTLLDTVRALDRRIGEAAEQLAKSQIDTAVAWARKKVSDANAAAQQARDKAAQAHQERDRAVRLLEARGKEIRELRAQIAAAAETSR